jgi:hypothetical protein
VELNVLPVLRRLAPWTFTTTGRLKAARIHHSVGWPNISNTQHQNVLFLHQEPASRNIQFRDARERQFAPVSIHPLSEERLPGLASGSGVPFAHIEHQRSTLAKGSAKRGECQRPFVFVDQVVENTTTENRIVSRGRQRQDVSDGKGDLW